MQSIQKNKHSTRKKALVIASIVALVVIGSVLAYIWLHSSENSKNASSQNKSVSNTHKIDLNAASNEQKKAGDEQKQTTADSTANNSGTTAGNDTPLDVTITAFNQNGNQIQIRSLIDEVSSTGSCTLTLTSASGTTVTRSSDIQAMPSSSTCKGFDLSTSELTPGTWKAMISVTIGTQTGSANKTLTIQ